MASGAAAAAPKSDVAVVGVGDHTHAVNPARGRSQASPALRGYDSRKTALTTYNAPVATASEFDKVSGQVRMKPVQPHQVSAAWGFENSEHSTRM